MKNIYSLLKTFADCHWGFTESQTPHDYRDVLLFAVFAALIVLLLYYGDLLCPIAYVPLKQITVD